MENKNVELEKKEIAEVKEETNVPEKKGLVSRAADGVKKHWKSALVALGCGVLGFVLGSQSVKADDSDDNEMFIETDDFTVSDDEE